MQVSGESRVLCLCVSLQQGPLEAGSCVTMCMALGSMYTRTLTHNTASSKLLFLLSFCLNPLFFSCLYFIYIMYVFTKRYTSSRLYLATHPSCLVSLDAGTSCVNAKLSQCACGALWGVCQESEFRELIGINPLEVVPISSEQNP